MFSEDTFVTVQGKGEVRMANIKVGDKVLSSISPNCTEYTEVTDVYHNIKHNPTTRINGIKCSCYAQFIKKDNKVRMAKHLKKGDLLYGDIKVVDKEFINSKKTIINLETKTHTYYVGNILVHDGRED